MDCQFIHIEAVSKAGRDLYRKINGHKEKAGSISVSSILGEAGRYEGYITHIENPLDPIILFGDKDRGVEAVFEKIDDWYKGTKDARGHKVRIDGNACLSGIISW